MIFTATPEPEHTPPRVRLDIATGDPVQTITKLTVMRDGAPIRDQPFIGGSATVAYDYEAPFGTDVTYSADGNKATYAAALNVNWSSLTGWTTSSGSPSVSGGFLTASGTADAVIYRVNAPANASRMVLNSPPGFGGSINVGEVRAGFNNGFTSFAYAGDFTGLTWTTGPATLTWDDRSLTVSTHAGTVVIPRGVSGATPVSQISVRVMPAKKVPAFTLFTPAETPFTATASISLDVTEAWLVHPIFPSLSCSIDPGQHKFRDSGINVDATTKTNVNRAARSTTHEPIGRRRSVVFTSGPRAAAQWDLILRTRDLESRNLVDAICDDQAPLLLRSPHGWPWDLPDGWYSVGDYTEERTRPRLDSADRRMTLPLTPVDAPNVRVAALWTYAADLLTHPTYADSLTAFPTYLDRLAGP